MKRVLAAALVLLASGCEGVTEIVVEVRSDLAVPEELDEIRVEVDGTQVGAGRQQRRIPLTGTGDDGPALPVRVVLVHDGGPLGPLRVIARGVAGGDEVVSQSARTAFRRGRTVILPMALSRSCRDRTCGAEETCVDGRCEPLEPPALDAGLGDADGGPGAGTDAGPAGADAGPDPDAGPTGPDAGGCPAGCPCSQVCTGGCTCDDGCGCELSCPSGEDCESVRCEHGATCELDARGASNLAAECRHGATCTVDARGASNVLDVVCREDSVCEVDCGDVSNCVVRCENEARCRVRCAGASNCRIEGCGDLDDDVDEGDGHLDCGDGWRACRTSCP